MKNHRQGFVTLVPLIAIVSILSLGAYFYVSKTVHRQTIPEIPGAIYSIESKKESENFSTTSTTSGDSENLTTTSTSSELSTSVINKSTKKKFDPNAPIIQYYPGINGKEKVDLTKIIYPDCAVAETRREYNPQPLNLASKTGLIIQEDTNYYLVSGTNEFYLYYEIWNCTIPTRDMVNGADAVTETHLNYSYQFDSSGGQVCNISNVSTGLHISYLLPKWKYAPVASGELLDIWNAYFTGIKKHEERHGSIAKEYARKLYTYLKDLSDNNICVPTEKVIQDKFNQIIEELDAAQAKYDADVDHGVNEGVFSPFDNIIKRGNGYY